jgi:hypothetical protein
MKEIKVKINGKDIPLSEFPKEFVVNTICGMLKSLKGVEEIKDAEISFTL